MLILFLFVLNPTSPEQVQAQNGTESLTVRFEVPSLANSEGEPEIHDGDYILEPTDVYTPERGSPPSWWSNSGLEDKQGSESGTYILVDIPVTIWNEGNSNDAPIAGQFNLVDGDVGVIVAQGSYPESSSRVLNEDDARIPGLSEGANVLSVIIALPETPNIDTDQSDTASEMAYDWYQQVKQNEEASSNIAQFRREIGKLQLSLRFGTKSKFVTAEDNGRDWVRRSMRTNRDYSVLYFGSEEVNRIYDQGMDRLRNAAVDAVSVQFGSSGNVGSALVGAQVQAGNFGRVAAFKIYNGCIQDAFSEGEDDGKVQGNLAEMAAEKAADVVAINCPEMWRPGNFKQSGDRRLQLAYTGALAMRVYAPSERATVPPGGSNEGGRAPYGGSGGDHDDNNDGGDREGQLPHTVTINGRTSPQSTDYTIEVSGKIEDHKGIGTREGVVQNNRAEGTVGTGKDEYRFSGRIESISLTRSSGATVLVDGKPRDGGDGKGSGNGTSGGDDRLPGSGYHLPASPPDYLNKSCLRGENFGFSPPNPRLIVHKYDADNNCRISHKELSKALSDWTQNDDFTNSELDMVTSAWEWSSGN